MNREKHSYTFNIMKNTELQYFPSLQSFTGVLIVVGHCLDYFLIGIELHMMDLEIPIGFVQ